MNLILPKHFIFLFLLILSSSAYAQKEMINKQIPSRSKYKKLSGDVALKDRFGNLYHPNEIAIKTNPTVTSSGSSGGAPVSFSMPFPIKDSCTSGMFKLHFVEEPVSGTGFSLAAHRDVICEVFRDISRLIENQGGSSAPYINIMVASDTSITIKNSGISLPTGVDIVGTSFEPVKYNLKNAWMDNIIYTSIKNGKSAYINLMGMNNQLHSSFYNYTHGLLIVNFKNKTWYTNFNDTSSIPSTQDDLYTHTLQQALHMLGLSSNILQNGNARGGNNLYTRYDNYLFKNTSSSKLFTYSSSTKQITNTTTLPFGCSSPNDIRFIGGTSNIHVYNDTPWNANINLSNFSCAGNTCNANYAKPNNHYVMVPCLQSGHTYIKRHPHQDEVYALCDLGYKLRAIGGVYAYGANTSNNASQGNVYKTYSSCTEPCIAVGGHDTIIMDSVRACTRTFSTKILTNDIPLSSIIPRMDLLDTTQGTLTFTATGFTFTPKPYFKYGEVRIVYFPQCNATAQLGNATYITIRYPYPPLPPCVTNNDCNNICYGTFEETDDPSLWHGFLIYDPIFDYNTADLWNSTGSVTCWRNVIDNYWLDCNYDDVPGCNFRTYGIHPHIDGGNQFIGIYAESGADHYSEGIHLKLKKPIYNDVTKRLKLKFLAKVYDGCNPFKMLVVANDSFPVSTTLRVKNIGGSTTCITYCDTIASAALTADTWAYYTVPISQPKVGDSFTDIIVLSDVATIPFEPNYYLHYCFFDNFEIYDSLATRAVITSNPHSLIPCNDTTQTIEYYVCLDNSVGLNSDSIIVQVDLPYGFTIASGSDFDATGRYKIPAGTISNTFCDTLKLKYNIDYTKVATDRGHTITAGYTCHAYCVSEISDWVKVYPKNHTITINKTVSNANPAIGDTIIFTYIISNSSPLNISDIVFLDTFPSNLVPRLFQSGPSLNGQILSYQLSLDSAHSISNPRTIQFSCQAIVKSDCKIPTKAHIKSITNPCFKGSDTLTLNAASTGSPVTASIRPVSAIWCGNNIPLQAVIANPSGTYTYQWIKDVTNVGTNSANHLATSNGRYSVRISQNGCISVIDAKAFDTALIVKDSVTHTRCIANIGSIHITPKNGIRPYTFTWSSSAVTDSFRTGLTDGSYTVTVTDSIGCSKVLTVVVSRLYDTLTINKTINNPICTTSNGSFSVSASGGSTPYSFLWNGGSTQANRTGLSAGSYYLTITDFNGCSIKDTSVLTIATRPVIVNDSIRVSCGLNKGSIYLKPVPSGRIYTYLWQDGDTNQNRINVTSGTYSVIITDSFGCVGYDTFVINGMSQPLSIVDSFHHPKCNLPNGKIFTHVSGGVPPYTYTWAHSSTHLSNLTGLTPGSYAVTITDAMGCTIVRNYNLIDQFVALEAYLYGGCISGNTTNVKVTIVEGDRPLTYLWSNGSTDSFINNLNVTSNPTVSVTITNPIGCNIVLTKTISTAGAISIGTGTTYPNSSSMVGVLAFGIKPFVTNKKFIVKGTFTVDESIGFENCDFEADTASKIVVTNTSYPNLIDNYTSLIGCHFYTCGTQLWKGIELKHVWGINFGGLIVFNSVIEDALYGVDFHSGELTGFDFVSKNCFIGLLNRSGVGTSFRRKMTFIGCGIDSIKKPYTNIRSDYFNSTHDTVLTNSRRSYCGIEYNDVHYAFTNEYMQFYNLSNGVIFNRVNLAKVEKSYFENIYYDAKLRHKNLPNGIPMHLNSGAAILANGSLNLHTLNVSHIDPNYLMIKNAYFGVVTNGGNVSISNLKMDNVYTGGFVNYGNLNVNNTSVTAMNRGYGYRQEIAGTAGQSTNITNNFIQSDGAGIGLYSGAGSTVNNGGTIGYNTIISGGNSALFAGIDMIAINNIIVADNYVYSDNYFKHAYNYEYCSGVSEQYNSAEMPSGKRLFTIHDWSTGAAVPTLFPVGYYYNFTEHTSRCNYANNMKIGVRYTGLCINSDLVGTEIYNHDIGIKIDNTVTLKHQVHNGNAFLDTCNFEVRSDQPPFNLTTFFVNSSSSSAMWASPRHPITPDIFQPGGGIDNIDCAIPLPPAMPEEGQSLRDNIQQNLLEFPEFEPQLLWQNHAWYYDYLMHRDTLSEGEETYLEDMAGTNIEKLNLLNQEEMELYQTSLTRLEQMKSIASQMKNNLNALANYSLVNLSLLDSPQLAQHKAQVQAVQTTIDFQDSLLQLLRLQGITTTQNQLDTLASQNNLLVPEMITDSLQQLFNALYYSTYAQEQYILDAEQLAGFQFLASQCPLLNADAVFRSRAIVQSQADTIRRYSDEAICKAAGYEYKSTKNRKPFSKKSVLTCDVYPNPASAYTNLRFNSIPEGSVSIEIIDLLGRKMYQLSESLNSNLLEVNTSLLQKGMYILSVSVNGSALSNFKLKIENQ